MSESVRESAKNPEALKEDRTSQTRKSDYSQPVNFSIDRILFLQRTIGNQAIGRLIKSGVLQAKLRTGQPGDIYEQEADRVAEQVMRISAPVQRKCLECDDEVRRQPKKEEETLQAEEISGSTSEATSELETYISALRGGGQPLPESARAFFEPRFQQDFNDVRVHTDTPASNSANNMNAIAYTVGTNIVFGDRNHSPDTIAGKSLLAHELSHVIRQKSSEKETVGISHAPVGTLVQRKIRLGGTDLDEAGVRQLANDLVANKLKDVVPGVVSAQLVLETVREMHAVSDILDFIDAEAVASDVRHRVLLSHYMRVSQGSTPLRKAFSYPDRKSDGTEGVGPKVNDDAAAYWGPVQDDYYFDLSPTGLLNPYEAIVKLFKEWTDPHKRTLIHCDYLVSVLEFRAYAENIGIPRFNLLVQTGALPIQLKWNGFTDLLQTPAISVGPFNIPLAPTAPLKEVPVSSKNDLIVGDHVVFYNHESYDALIEGVGGIWRLENAIVIDRVSGQFRYQGHGYFSPVTEDVLLDGMIRQYNRHVDEARGIIYRTEHGSAVARQAASDQLTNDYPNVKRKMSGGWEVRGQGLCGNIVTRDLKHLTRAEAPGLIDPCSGEILVKRPVEQKP